jgi:hypothetical protein
MWPLRDLWLIVALAAVEQARSAEGNAAVDGSSIR